MGYEVDIRKTDTSDYDFLTGHFGFDAIAPENCRIVSLIRDPVDRFLSHYYYWHRRGINGELSGGDVEVAANHSLGEFLDLIESGTEMIQLDNLITWMFAGGFEPWIRRELAHLSQDELLDLAKRNIQSCAVVGRLDDMPRFLDDLKRELGLELQVSMLNRNQDRMPTDQLPGETLDRIRSYLALDIQLYDWFKTHQTRS